MIQNKETKGDPGFSLISITIKLNTYTPPTFFTAYIYISVYVNLRMGNNIVIGRFYIRDSGSSYMNFGKQGAILPFMNSETVKATIETDRIIIESL